jgi:hypothetical protein
MHMMYLGVVLMLIGVAVLFVIIRMPSLGLCRAERHALWTSLMDDNHSDHGSHGHGGDIPMHSTHRDSHEREPAETGAGGIIDDNVPTTRPMSSSTTEDISGTHYSVSDGSGDHKRSDSSSTPTIYQPKRPPGKPTHRQQPSSSSATMSDVAITPPPDL